MSAKQIGIQFNKDINHIERKNQGMLINKQNKLLLQFCTPELMLGLDGLEYRISIF